MTGLALAILSHPKVASKAQGLSFDDVLILACLFLEEPNAAQSRRFSIWPACKPPFHIRQHSALLLSCSARCTELPCGCIISPQLPGALPLCARRRPKQCRSACPHASQTLKPREHLARLHNICAGHPRAVKTIDAGVGRIRPGERMFEAAGLGNSIRSSCLNHRLSGAP